MKIEYPEGATPLDPVEAEGLRLPHITTREQLNEWEQENILDAERKYFSRRQPGVLTEAFIIRLHLRWSKSARSRMETEGMRAPAISML